MNENERLDHHQKFRELAALNQRGTLNEGERLELDRHLKSCGACRQVSDEYALIGTEGMTFLAEACGFDRENEDWDNRSARSRIFARIREAERSATPASRGEVVSIDGSVPRRSMAARWPAVAVAACVLVSVALGAYWLGGRVRIADGQPSSTSLAHQQDVASEKKASDDLIALQAGQLSQLQAQAAANRQEVARLREALRSADAHSAALAAANIKRDEELSQLAEQRDKLASQLRDAEQSYQIVQAQLTTLRAEHDRVLLRTTSLESKIDELMATSRDQDRRLRDNEQYLASDRDIRELMGARKLYIADVFDVDSGSRTRKPFGRVFYTQSKSLIFYAFDLDHEPGVKNASAFQVWGKRDIEVGEKEHAMNLGILYMDSESNRRWVLRLDDPKQLAEIDAVFVTVEPHGGSQKPTGKPFLYALLRREANHP